MRIHDMTHRNPTTPGSTGGRVLAVSILLIAIAYLVFVLAACTTTIEEIEFRPCDPTLDASSSSDTSVPPDFTCPTIANGDIVFAIDGYPSRTVNFSNVGGSSASGPLLLYWHGTYEGATSPLTNALPYGFMSQATAAGALVAMPRASTEATGRTAPFPWFSVCAQVSPSLCDRDDDFVLAEAVAFCAVEQGHASPNRLTSSGMSAGGVFTAQLIEHGIGAHSLAGAVTWSGGEPLAAQPTVADDARTAVLAMHGGTNDVYCGVGNPAGSCSGYQPYSFVQPSEQLASDIDDGVADADGFAAVCNHGGGHNAQMGPQGAEFLTVADLAAGHPWRDFPYGVDGYGSWPSMSGGTNWMLRFYGDCHNAL